MLYKEELDGALRLFNEVPGHVLRIGWIARPSQGHLLILGGSGAGGALLFRFGCKDEMICFVLGEF